jgi:hypothetical protein
MFQVPKELTELEERGYCWSIGRTKICKYEIRIWPARDPNTAPVIIQDGISFEDSLKKALTKLGDQDPYNGRVK